MRFQTDISLSCIAPDSFEIYECHVVQETKQLYKSILSTFHKKKIQEPYIIES